MPARDGTLLQTDVYFPPDPGPHPVILERSPYADVTGMKGCFTTNAIGDPVPPLVYFAQHGYVTIHQYSRGTWGSQGVFTPFFADLDDGYDAVEWAARQPWSTGKVGMTGASYLGATQWLAAIQSPPHLAAFAPHMIATDYHDHWVYRNGVPDLAHMLSWGLLWAEQERIRAGEASGLTYAQAQATADEIRKAKFGDFVWKTPLVAGLPFPHKDIDAWLAHPDYDAYWAKLDDEAHFDKVTAPALLIDDWYDDFYQGAVRGFAGLRHQGGAPAARDGARLIMEGGGSHLGPGIIDWGPTHKLDYLAIELRFFDRYLKGQVDGPEEPRVRLFVQEPPDAGLRGGGFWTALPDFPTPRSTQMSLYLTSGGRANSRRGDGSLSASAQPTAPDRYEYDPQNPVRSNGGGQCCEFTLPAGVQDQAEAEARKDVLVYTGPVAGVETVILGEARVTLWASSSAPDTDFAVKLTDVTPDGKSLNIVNRLVRARYRNGSKSKPSLIEPNKPYAYNISLGYTAWALRPGHRLRLDVTSSDFPYYARNLNTAENSVRAAAGVIARQTIFHDPTHPSVLQLPIVRRSDLPVMKTVEAIPDCCSAQAPYRGRGEPNSKP
jgi:hypothetical protein